MLSGNFFFLPFFYICSIIGYSVIICTVHFNLRASIGCTVQSAWGIMNFVAARRMICRLDQDCTCVCGMKQASCMDVDESELTKSCQ